MRFIGYCGFHGYTPMFRYRWLYSLDDISSMTTTSSSQIA
nr:MAG TPA: protein of unknown function (DUF4735) [Caudoviricetes sp.]DAO14855.1 MAG TPA: protein of unknown function (DUF4735) [Bacteriophage sp.]DAR91949.1 MAG TPA: protein of unknown function (DUF4735) [Bacteriophage sp.]